MAITESKEGMEERRKKEKGERKEGERKKEGRGKRKKEKREGGRKEGRERERKRRKPKNGQLESSGRQPSRLCCSQSFQSTGDELLLDDSEFHLASMPPPLPSTLSYIID